jgi:hypothetical protein
MYTVRANDPSGRPMTFACGTADQALDKAQELTSRGFSEVFVTAPSGQVWSAAAFARRMGD